MSSQLAFVTALQKTTGTQVAVNGYFQVSCLHTRLPVLARTMAGYFDLIPNSSRLISDHLLVDRAKPLVWHPSQHH